MTSPSTLLRISNEKKLLTFVEGSPMMFMEKTCSKKTSLR
jgi:hypothetical protein